MYKRNTCLLAFIWIVLLVSLFLGACRPVGESAQEPAPEGSALLIFPYTEFSVEDAAGRTLAFTGGDLEGDLELLSQQVVPRGPAPAELQLTVPASGAFTYRTESQNADFSATFADFTGGAGGDGVQEVCVTADGSVTATGQDMQYRIGLMLGQEDYAYFTVEGSGGGTVSLRRGRQGLELQGAVGTCILSVLRENGQELQSVSLIFSGELVTLELTEQDVGPVLRVHAETGVEEFPLTEQPDA